MGLVLTDFPLDLSNPQQASSDTVYNPPWLADDFVDAITDDPKVLSFNVISLFTSIPLQLTLKVVLRPPSTNDTANHLFSQRTLYGPTTPLSDLDLLFVQLQGPAMGSPVSVVAAEVVSRKGVSGLDNEFHGGLSLDIYTIRKIVPKGIYTPFNHNTRRSRNKMGASKNTI